VGEVGLLTCFILKDFFVISKEVKRVLKALHRLFQMISLISIIRGMSHCLKHLILGLKDETWSKKICDISRGINYDRGVLQRRG